MGMTRRAFLARAATAAAVAAGAAPLMGADRAWASAPCTLGVWTDHLGHLQRTLGFTFRGIRYNQVIEPAELPDVARDQGASCDIQQLQPCGTRIAQLELDKHPAGSGPDFVWELIRAGLDQALGEHSVADLCREAAERGVERAALDPASYEI